MRVPVKLFGFVVWLLSLHCGQCEVCLRDSITYQNVEPLPEASYADGKNVSVSCQTGFFGMYRLNCENGQWKENIVRPCQKNQCSHPGDAANGDFQLVDATDFVFGATVVYSCKKGFEMTSRINQRTCRFQGWDNAVPVCEARLPVPVIISESPPNSSVQYCSLVCSVASVSAVSLSWYKENHLLSSINVSDLNNSISLHLECLDGSYSCVVSNPISNLTKHVNVTEHCQLCSDCTFCCHGSEVIARLVISALVGVATVVILVYDIITSRKGENEGNRR